MSTRYILELCDTSGAHRPVARFESTSRFTAVHVGDRFDDIGSLCLNLTPFDGPSSPVWGNE